MKILIEYFSSNPTILYCINERQSGYFIDDGDECNFVLNEDWGYVIL